mmetsp:Transcript_14352/g.29389  ORF Transcript_14352/g.29389 Transcript_14352/m.29389 type:complete len:144 (-) Transcript_14352:580-1011(-)
MSTTYLNFPLSNSSKLDKEALDLLLEGRSHQQQSSWWMIPSRQDKPGGKVGPQRSKNSSETSALDLSECREWNCYSDCSRTGRSESIKELHLQLITLRNTLVNMHCCCARGIPVQPQLRRAIFSVKKKVRFAEPLVARIIRSG